jgi:hypothetical protein
MAVFMVFNLWIGSGFIFETVVNFEFFNIHFPVTTLGLELFSGTSLLFLWCPVTGNSAI